MRKIAMHKMFLVIYSVYLKASYTVYVRTVLP